MISGEQLCELRDTHTGILLNREQNFIKAHLLFVIATLARLIISLTKSQADHARFFYYRWDACGHDSQHKALEHREGCLPWLAT